MWEKTEITGSQQIHKLSRMQKKKGFPGGSAIKNLPVMEEMQGQSLGQEDTLEREMATQSSILAWKTPWTEKPGGLLFCPTR